MASPKQAVAKLPSPLSQSRLIESLQLKRGHPSRQSEGFWLERDLLQATLFSSLCCYGLFDWLIYSMRLVNMHGISVVMNWIDVLV